MEIELAMDRIRHRIMAGMVDRSTFSVKIAQGEAHALIGEVYSALNTKYLDALQKGDGLTAEEATLKSPATLRVLQKMRTVLRKKEGYNEILADPSFERDFGAKLEVQG